MGRAAKVIAYLRVRRATAAFLILGLGNILALSGVEAQHFAACRDRQHQYAAIHDVITKAYAPGKASPVLLHAFPQLAPFYTPGNPLYKAQVDAANGRRDQVLGVLGDRPTCALTI